MLVLLNSAVNIFSLTPGEFEGLFHMVDWLPTLLNRFAFSFPHGGLAAHTPQQVCFFFIPNQVYCVTLVNDIFSMSRLFV